MAKTFTQFMEEANISVDYIETRLFKMGYTIKRDSSRMVSVLVDTNRIDALQKISKEFADLKAYYDPNKGSSSVGAVVVGSFTIKARPASKQGKKSAGLDNEDAMIDNIKMFVKGGSIHVNITDGKKSYRYKDVIDIKGVGGDTTDRKKADVILVLKSAVEIPISIKKDNAEMWESADSYWAAIAKKIVDREEANGTITVTPKGGVSAITPSIAIKADNAEKKAVVFGNDLLGKGFVVVRTFRATDFKLDESGETLNITTTKIIDKMTDLTGTHEIYFLIRNDSSRKGSKIRPGLRVLAVNATRINKNVKVVTK
jgi:hypothetical protein